MSTNDSKNTQPCTIHNVMARFLPLTWFVWVMWKLGFLKRDYDGCYRGDPEAMRISRWIFSYVPIRGKTKKGTQFCGNWHWRRFLVWEVHLLIKDKASIGGMNRVDFP